jgi:hypothetical protein
MPPVHEKSTAEGEVAVFNYEELDQLSNQIRLLRILPPKTKSKKCLWDNSGEVQCFTPTRTIIHLTKHSHTLGGVHSIAGTRYTSMGVVSK